ncbi:hypothetical protein N8144_06290 [Planktomarina temperata]|jgi:hypothetical protein|nr:hypothetical protein [Planktomarina temperata]
MTEQATYYKPTKLDYLYDAATFINDEVNLVKIINKMENYQIRAVYDEFEDPYSSFNYDREYSDCYWSRFKKAVAVARPDAILM